MAPIDTVTGLTRHIRDAVRPHLGALHGRRVSGTAQSGDATFAIDDIAEEAIVSFLEQSGLSIAYYSEDKGLVTFGSSPQSVLVIDPIDGTRPAAAGLETCVVSVALADYRPDATLGSVQWACIGEIKTDDLFVAERGAGVRRYDAAGKEAQIRRLAITDVALAPISFEAVARPIGLIAGVIGDIVDTAGLRGGAFLFSSIAFSLTRLVTGQLAGAMDVGPRILRDCPESRAAFAKLGGGRPVGINSYDLAAAVLIAEEGGATVTDAYGRSLAEMPLLDSSEQNLTSLLAASNPELHATLLGLIDEGVGRLRIEMDTR